MFEYFTVTTGIRYEIWNIHIYIEIQNVTDFDLRY